MRRSGMEKAMINRYSGLLTLIFRCAAIRVLRWRRESVLSSQRSRCRWISRPIYKSTAMKIEANKTHVDGRRNANCTDDCYGFSPALLSCRLQFSVDLSLSFYALPL